MDSLASWLEAWAVSAAAQPAPAGAWPPSPTGAHWSTSATAEMWLRLIEATCKLSQDRDVAVRATACEVMQRAIIAAERMHVAPGALEASLSLHLLPSAKAMVRRIGSKDTPSADKTARELASTISKLVLLFTPVLQVRAQSNVRQQRVP